MLCHILLPFPPALPKARTRTRTRTHAHAQTHTHTHTHTRPHAHISRFLPQLDAHDLKPLNKTVLCHIGNGIGQEVIKSCNSLGWDLCSLFGIQDFANRCVCVCGGGGLCVCVCVCVVCLSVCVLLSP